jgi:hypothetical protein
VALGGTAGNPAVGAVTVPLWPQPYDRPRARHAARVRPRPDYPTAGSPRVSEPHRPARDSRPWRCDRALAPSKRRRSSGRVAAARLAAWKCCNLYPLRGVYITRGSAEPLAKSLRSGFRRLGAAGGRRLEACGQTEDPSRWWSTTAPPAVRPLPKLQTIGPAPPDGLHDLEPHDHRGVRRNLSPMLADPERFSHP